MASTQIQIVIALEKLILKNSPQINFAESFLILFYSSSATTLILSRPETSG